MWLLAERKGPRFSPPSISRHTDSVGKYRTEHKRNLEAPAMVGDQLSIGGQ